MNIKNMLIVFCIFLAIGSWTTQTQTVLLVSSVQITPSFYFSVERDWSSISLLYPDQYHTPEELVEELHQINNTAPEIIDFFTIGESFEGRKIYCLRVTNEQNTNPKAGTLIIAQHHAREQISMEVSLRFLHRLVNNYGTDEKITEYIDSQEIFVIPSLNPDGLHYVLGNSTLLGDNWLRKNMRRIDDDGDGLFNEDPPDDANHDGIISEYRVYSKPADYWLLDYDYLEGTDDDGDLLVNEDPRGGVDLNRNYGYRWNDPTITSGSGTDTTSETYPGTAPFSEPETLAFRDFMENKSFSTAISLHSGINATLFPWGSENYYAEYTLYNDLFYDIEDILPSKYLSYGGIQQLGYKTAGDWGDWMYEAKECLVPMTFEIYHNTSSDAQEYVIVDNPTYKKIRWDGIYGFFNPREAYIDALWNDIQPVFDYWLDITPRLIINIESISGSKNSGDTLEVMVSIENLSPRLSTINDLNVVHSDFSSLLYQGSPVTISKVKAQKTIGTSFYFELEAVLDSGDNVSLLLGNDYVGYTPIIIQEENVQEGGVDQGTSFGFLTALLAIPVIIALKSINAKKREEL
jgi:hypothetical protein